MNTNADNEHKNYDSQLLQDVDTAMLTDLDEAHPPGTWRARARIDLKPLAPSPLWAGPWSHESCVQSHFRCAPHGITHGQQAQGRRRRRAQLAGRVGCVSCAGFLISFIHEQAKGEKE